MPVKLILRQHVDHLGDRGEIVSVAPGFARNFLLPKGLALEATAGNLKNITHQRKVWAARENQEVQEAETVAARIAELELVVSKKAGESGTLYGSVTTTEIMRLLADRGVEVERRQIDPDGPIKALGEFDIPIKLHRNVTARAKLQVVGEGDAD